MKARERHCIFRSAEEFGRGHKNGSMIRFGVDLEKYNVWMLIEIRQSSGEYVRAGRESLP